MSDKEKTYVFQKTLFDPSILLSLMVLVIGFIVILVNNNEFVRKLGAVIMIVGGIATIMMCVLVRAYKLEIGEKHCTIKNGILTIRNEQILITNICSVKITEDVFGRLLGYGDVTFDIIGKQPVSLPKIHNAQKVKDILDSKMNV